VKKGDLNTVDEIKRLTSGAVCASIFSIIISLVSIIFALEVYTIYVAKGVCS